MLVLTGPCPVSTVSYIMNQAFYLCLKMVKITAARSICAYHIGNKARWLCPLPRGTFHIPKSGGPSPFHAQKPKCSLSM